MMICKAYRLGIRPPIAGRCKIRRINHDILLTNVLKLCLKERSLSYVVYDHLIHTPSYQHSTFYLISYVLLKL